MEHDPCQHVGQAHVDRELRGAKNLARGVDTEPSLAPEYSVRLSVLRLDTIRNRHRFGRVRQLSEIRTLPAGMRHDTRVDFHFRRRDAPCFCGGGNQAGACLSRDQAVAGPEGPCPVGAAGDLEASAHQVAVDIAVRRRSV